MSEFIVFDAIRIKKQSITHYHKWIKEIHIYGNGEPLIFSYDTPILAKIKLHELDEIFGVILNEQIKKES